jgi:ring-1,2-phenylacetyl-CoA epoxidase subunit PaaB
MTEGNANAYDLIASVENQNSDKEAFEIYHLTKRGKQHIHAGTVMAISYEEAMAIAKQELKGDKTIYNIWAIRTADIRFTTPEDKDFWLTLPEKKFRDAGDYKGGDKLKDFLERAKS